MAMNEAGLSDEVRAEINGKEPARIPDRPAASAKKSRWVEYVIALGMHPGAADELSTNELIDMADRLEG